MTDKDKEIIKALEDWIKNFDGKAVDFITLNSTLDLINRQQAEIDRLIGDVTTYQLRWAKATAKLEVAKSEARKEFAERLIIQTKGLLGSKFIKEQTNKLLKEMDGV